MTNESEDRAARIEKAKQRVEQAKVLLDAAWAKPSTHHAKKQVVNDLNDALAALEEEVNR